MVSVDAFGIRNGIVTIYTVALSFRLKVSGVLR
jgi:hypothetical protein